MPNLNSEIRVIGPRKSGKTTYLATLADCPYGLGHKYPGIKVIPRNDEAQGLQNLAKDLLRNQRRIAGNFFDSSNLHNQPYYDFLIQLPTCKIYQGIDLEVTARDFPGEFFEDVPVPHKWPEIKTWFDDLFTTTSWMVMMTDWDPDRDESLYLPAFKKLYQEIRTREIRNAELKTLRIAIVMAKCERGELWPCRHDADEDLFEIRLRKTYQFLTDSFSFKQIQFFACSAFGVLGDSRREDFDPRPNCIFPDDGSLEENNAYLRDPDRWYPYGLIPPLYWLATGSRIEE